MMLSKIQNTSFTLSGDLLKPVWSKQHGAYITLITSWLIGALLSESLSLLHAAVLVLLLAGFNAAEILIDTVKRRSPQLRRKVLWMKIYGIGAIAMAYVMWQNSPLFQSMLPVFVLGGALFSILSLKRLQKTIPAELITFMLFSAAGLLAYNPSSMPETPVILTLWVILTAYFCLSVFHVKYRIEEIGAKPLVIYLITAVIVVLIVDSFSLTALLIATLLILKSVPLLVVPEIYRSLKIKNIGYLEMAMQIILIVIVVLTKQFL